VQKTYPWFLGWLHSVGMTQKKHSYTPEEEQALAEELAEIIIKNGGFP